MTSEQARLAELSGAAGGPYDVYKPLPWDAHSYPTELPDLTEAQRLWERARDISAWMAEAWAKRGGKASAPVRTPKRPGNLPALPAVSTAGQVTLRDPSALGLPGELVSADRERLGVALWDLVSKTSQLDLYTAWLRAAGIRYFSADELTRHRWRHTSRVQPGRSGAWSALFEALPPEVYPAGIWPVLPKCVVPEPRLWPSILPTLRVLDRFRHWLGEPVTGISGYRLPFYNVQIKGSANSYHMHNCSVDFTFKDKTRGGELDARIFYDFYTSLYNVKGDGVGVYDDFIHFDVGLNRHKVGRYLRWYHRGRKDQTIFARGERVNYVGSAE